MKTTDVAIHIDRATTLSAMLADMIGNMLDDGEATEGLYVLALEVRDHLEAATAAN